MLKTIPQLVEEVRGQLRCVSMVEAINERKLNQGVVVDVREVAEVAESPVSQSTSIPRGVLEMKMSSQYPNANTAVYIHCATGMRAILAAEQLQRLGYQNVSVITCDLATICRVSA